MSSSTEASKNSKAPNMLRSPYTLLLGSLRLYRSAFWVCLGFSSWLLFPAIGTFVLSFFPTNHLITQLLNIVFFLTRLGISFWVSLYLTFLFQSFLHGSSNLPEDLSARTKQHYLPYILAAALTGLTVLAGFFALIIPGIIAAVWFAFVQFITVLEEKQGEAAFRASRELSRHRFFPVLTRLFVGPFFISLMSSLCASLIVLIIAFISGVNPFHFTETDTLPGWVSLTESVVNLFVLPWLVSYMILLYNHLKETLLS